MARRQVQSCAPSRSTKISRVAAVAHVAACAVEQEAASSVAVTEDVEMSSPRNSELDILDASKGNETDIVPLAGDKFINGLGIVLALWVQETADTTRPRKIARFHSSMPPPISIQDYIKRLRKYFLCSDECFVMALVYIDKIGKTNDSMTVCDLTVHRLLVIAVMIASKFHDDKFYDNRYYGKAGGLSLREVNVLEALMLQELQWKALVTVEEYQLYHNLVCEAVKGSS